MSAEPPVLDASAALAYLRREEGFAVVREALSEGVVISTVNLAEVHSTVTDRVIDAAAALARMTAMGMQVVPFEEQDARLVGELRPQTRALGLSLADRACLALGLRLGRPVLATDRTLAGADVGVDVVLIR